MRTGDNPRTRDALSEMDVVAGHLAETLLPCVQVGTR